MGGAGITADVIDKVIDRLNIPEEEVEKTNQSGQSTVRNRIQWARLYLTKSGYLASAERGIWKLTDKGWGSYLSEQEIETLFKKVHQESLKSTKEQPASIAGKKIIPEEEYSTEEEAHTQKILNIIQALSPAGFEKLCKRLLTECGFQHVQVTGKSGDNGIDGIGLLEINDLVSFKVLFQCKRYKE
ncbi:MAG: winged helix-turn-helix domain-containing protein, partial [Sediminibacterium sp.]